jgi:hypothetical protein
MDSVTPNYFTNVVQIHRLQRLTGFVCTPLGQCSKIIKYGLLIRGMVPKSKLLYLAAIATTLIVEIMNVYPLMENSSDASSISKNSQLLKLDDILGLTEQTNNLSNIANDSTAKAANTQMKNYSEDSFDFSIQYPERWFPTTYGSRHYSDLIFFYAPLKNLTDLFPPKVGVAALKFANNISLAEYTNITLNVFNDSDQTVINGSEPTTLAGYPGHAVLLGNIDPDLGNVTYYTVNIWTVHNNNVYALTYEAPASKVKSYLGDFIKMMDSLRIRPE